MPGPAPLAILPQELADDLPSQHHDQPRRALNLPWPTRRQLANSATIRDHLRLAGFATGAARASALRHLLFRLGRSAG